jgi:hypothetical protein
MVSQIRLTSIYYEVFENIVIVAVQNVSYLKMYQNNILKKLKLIHQNDMKIKKNLNKKNQIFKKIWFESRS